MVIGFIGLGMTPWFQLTAESEMGEKDGCVRGGRDANELSLCPDHYLCCLDFATVLVPLPLALD